MLDRYQFDILLTYNCNLKCYGCDTYSDYLKGNQHWDYLKECINNWSKRLVPLQQQNRIPFDKVKIMGGEPTLYKELPEVIYLLSEKFPNWKVVLGTNGLLLHKKPKVLEAIKETKTSIFISKHFNDKNYLKKLKYSLKESLEYLGDDYKLVNKKNGFVNIIDTTRQNYWTMFNKRDETGIHPYNDNDIRSSWERCHAKYCKSLYKNELYKCCVHAFLKDALAHWGQLDDLDWQPYIKSNQHPATLEMTDDELVDWCLTDEESICNMCPSQDKHIDNTIKQNGIVFK